MKYCHGGEERWRLCGRCQEPSGVPAQRRFTPYITQTSTIYLDIYGGSSIQRGGGRGCSRSERWHRYPGNESLFPSGHPSTAARHSPPHVEEGGADQRDDMKLRGGQTPQYLSINPPYHYESIWIR